MFFSLFGLFVFVKFLERVYGLRPVQCEGAKQKRRQNARRDEPVFGTTETFHPYSSFDIWDYTTPGGGKAMEINPFPLILIFHFC